jgi:hypothetical protein
VCVCETNAPRRRTTATRPNDCNPTANRLQTDCKPQRVFCARVAVAPPPSPPPTHTHHPNNPNCFAGFLQSICSRFAFTLQSFRIRVALVSYIQRHPQSRTPMCSATPSPAKVVGGGGGYSCPLPRQTTTFMLPDAPRTLRCDAPLHSLPARHAAPDALSRESDDSG